jgi:hypothetical protein
MVPRQYVEFIAQNVGRRAAAVATGIEGSMVHEREFIMQVQRSEFGVGGRTSDFAFTLRQQNIRTVAIQTYAMLHRGLDSRRLWCWMECMLHVESSTELLSPAAATVLNSLDLIRLCMRN